MDFVSFASALECLGERFEPPDWYIDWGPPSTAAEMSSTWLADDLLRKYRNSLAAARLYAAIRAKEGKLDVYDNSLGVPAYAPQAAEYLESRARAIESNLSQCLDAVRRNEVVTIASTPTWWRSFDQGHITIGFDRAQFERCFALVEDTLTHPDEEPLVPMLSAENKGAAHEPTMATSTREGRLVHRVDGLFDWHGFVRLKIGELLQEHPGLAEEGPAAVRNAVWQKLRKV